LEVAEDADSNPRGLLTDPRFPSLPSAGQSMFRPHREVAITDMATDHEPCSSNSEVAHSRRRPVSVRDVI